MLMGVYELNNTYRVLRKHLGAIRGPQNIKHQSWQKLSQITKYCQTWNVNTGHVYDVWGHQNTCLGARKFFHFFEKRVPIESSPWDLFEYEVCACLVGSEMCIRDSSWSGKVRNKFSAPRAFVWYPYHVNRTSPRSILAHSKFWVSGSFSEKSVFTSDYHNFLTIREF